MNKRRSTADTAATRALPKDMPPVAVARSTVEPPSAPTEPAHGYVDAYGRSRAVGGWLFSGWVPRPLHLDVLEPVEFTVVTDEGEWRGHAILAFHQRADLDHKSVGVIAYVAGSGGAVGQLQSIAFSIGQTAYRAPTGHFTRSLNEPDIVGCVRANLANKAYPEQNRDQIFAVTARAGFTGQDTLGSLSETVLLEVDHAIACPPDGVLLKGWIQCAPSAVRGIRVRSGSRSAVLDLDNAVRIDRPDVVAVVGPRYGYAEVRCGFIAYVPGVLTKSNVTYLEVELATGEMGYKILKLSTQAGVAAIRCILEDVDVRPQTIDATFDLTLGPALASLNAARLQQPVTFTEITYGPRPSGPRSTVIIPLYGRIDFLEYQMALFSADWDTAGSELLYVLDDPGKRRELEILARSVFERFRLPFRVLVLDANVGFAAANNVGLREAHGEYICYLNSDIFPITQGWLERLINGLERHPDLGIIGARLLFEDGSVQHEGCYYEALSDYGGWTFIEHLNKGRRPDEHESIQRRDAITGACMVMRRALAAEIGGFDEAYIIGDFEDSDLCQQVRVRGLTVAVDLGVHLHHLERKSQHSPNDRWRMNLTLYNAWLHERRWFRANSAAVRATKTT